MRKNIVLFVNDDPDSLIALKRIAADEKYTALFADGVHEALEIINKQRISVVVTDLILSKMDGVDLLTTVKQQSPDTVKIVLSGRADISEVLASINRGGIFRLITKPWSAETDLSAVIREAVEYYNFSQDKKAADLELQSNSKAYKDLLSKMEEQLYGCNFDLNSMKDFVSMTLDFFQDIISNKDGKSVDVILKDMIFQLKVIKQINEKYMAIIPTVLEPFSLTDVVQDLKNYLTDQMSNMQYKPEFDSQIASRIFGNRKLLLFVLETLFDLLARAGGNRKFCCTTTITTYKQIVRTSNIMEIGYIDGAKQLIDEKETLSYSSLNYYCLLLNKLAKPYNSSVTFTYVNQNSSIIAVVSDFSPTKT